MADDNKRGGALALLQEGQLEYYKAREKEAQRKVRSEELLRAGRSAVSSSGTGSMPTLYNTITLEEFNKRTPEDQQRIRFNTLLKQANDADRALADPKSGFNPSAEQREAYNAAARALFGDDIRTDTYSPNTLAFVEQIGWKPDNSLTLGDTLKKDKDGQLRGLAIGGLGDFASGKAGISNAEWASLQKYQSAMRSGTGLAGYFGPATYDETGKATSRMPTDEELIGDRWNQGLLEDYSRTIDDLTKAGQYIESKGLANFQTGLSDFTGFTPTSILPQSTFTLEDGKVINFEDALVALATPGENVTSGLRTIMSAVEKYGLGKEFTTWLEARLQANGDKPIIPLGPGDTELAPQRTASELIDAIVRGM